MVIFSARLKMLGESATRIRVVAREGREKRIEGGREERGGRGFKEARSGGTCGERCLRC